MGDTIKDILTAPVSIAEDAVSGDPLKTAQALFAPSTILDEQPGVVGDVSKLVDTVVATYFGAPYATGLLGGAADLAGGAADVGATAADAGAAAADVGAAAADAGTVAGGLSGAIPEITVTGALPAAEGTELADAALLGASALAPALSGAGTGGAIASGLPSSSPAAPSSSAAGGAPANSPGSPLSIAGGGSQGGPVGGATANAAPGADIFNTSAPAAGGAGPTNTAASISDSIAPTGNDTFSISPAGNTAGGAYQSPGSNTLVFGSGNPSNVATAGGGGNGFLSSIFDSGNGSSSLPLGVDSASAGTSAAGGGTGGGSLGSRIASSIFGGSPTDTTNQIAGSIPSIAPLAYQAIAGQQPPKGTNALNSEATQLVQQGDAMTNYLSTGTLPPGLSTALDTASASAKAAIRSQYASRGESGSSAEATDLAAVDSRMAGQGAELALQLYQQGVSESQMGAQLQESLLSNTIAQDSQFSAALGQFAAALAGGGGQTIQLKTG